MSNVHARSSVIAFGGTLRIGLFLAEQKNGNLAVQNHHGLLAATKREVAMEHRYQEHARNVSDFIVDELRNHPDGVGEESFRRLDGFIFEFLMLVGLLVVQRLYNDRSRELRDEFRNRGFECSKRPTVSVHTLFGTGEVESPYFRHRGTGETARPMKDRYGVRGRGQTLELQRLLSDFGSEKSFAKAEEAFERIFGHNIGRTSILRTTRRAGVDAEEFLEERFDRLASSFDEGDIEEELLVELDGCLIRTGVFMTAQRAGLTGVDGLEPNDLVRQVEWKEVRTGLVQRDGDVDPLYAARHGDYSTICDQMFALASSLGLGFDTDVIGVCDGGNGLREALERVFAKLEFVLDYEHVKKHFRETAEALGIDERARKKWIRSFTELLWVDDEAVDDWEDQVDIVLERLRALQSTAENDRLRRLINFLDAYSDAIAFGEFLAKDWPTGSGKVESAHRHLVQERLKLAGACWLVENINPMMALRVIKTNGWWDEYCDWRLGQKFAA